MPSRRFVRASSRISEAGSRFIATAWRTSERASRTSGVGLPAVANKCSSMGLVFYPYTSLDEGEDLGAHGRSAHHFRELRPGGRAVDGAAAPAPGRVRAPGPPRRVGRPARRRRQGLAARDCRRGGARPGRGVARDRGFSGVGLHPRRGDARPAPAAGAGGPSRHPRARAALRLGGAPLARIGGPPPVAARARHLRRDPARDRRRLRRDRAGAALALSGPEARGDIVRRDHGPSGADLDEPAADPWQVPHRPRARTGPPRCGVGRSGDAHPFHRRHGWRRQVCARRCLAQGDGEGRLARRREGLRVVVLQPGVERWGLGRHVHRHRAPLVRRSGPDGGLGVGQGGAAGAACEAAEDAARTRWAGAAPGSTGAG